MYLLPVNLDKPARWKADAALSVDMYNKWFMKFAPETYRNARVVATREVIAALSVTSDLTDISPHILKGNPSILPILRMSTAPPVARDRLIGLAQVHPNLIKTMEVHKRIPPKLIALEDELSKIGTLILKMIDKDLFPWLEMKKKPTKNEVLRASTIVADRLCGTSADPIIRNAQEQRQLKLIGQWLDKRGYNQVKSTKGLKFEKMNPGSYTLHLNIPAKLSTGTQINISADAVIMPKQARPGEYPLLIEAKSAGDFTNTNKRRKEEATKAAQLRNSYGNSVRYALFLCGYFDAAYLGYEAAEGIDWIWEHRIDELLEFGV